MLGLVKINKGKKKREEVAKKREVVLFFSPRKGQECIKSALSYPGPHILDFYKSR